MTRHVRFTRCLLVFAAAGAALAAGSASRAIAEVAARAPSAVEGQRQVELFEAMRSGDVEAKIVVRNDHAARVFITNRTNVPLDIQLPEAFAAVPALGQFGGGGGGRGGGGGGARTGGGGGQQSAGGGLGGGGGGGGGVFSVPPEETGRIDVAVVCLDHGLRDPSSSKPYNLVPAEEHLDQPAMIELLKAFGRGELQHSAAQAATWHLNSGLSWDELAAKQQGTARNIHRPPYFSHDELRAGMAYAHEAVIRAQDAELNQPTQEKEDEEEPATEPETTPDEDTSEARSTQDSL